MKLDRFKKIYGICEDVTGALSKSWAVPIIVESLVLIGNTLVNVFFMLSGLMSTRANPGLHTSGYMDFAQLIISSIIHFYFLFQLSKAASKMVQEVNININ